MNWYTADLGKWEVGRTIEFQAKDDRTAFDYANAQTKNDEDVVQICRGKIGEKGAYVYDYMNGFYSRYPSARN